MIHSLTIIQSTGKYDSIDQPLTIATVPSIGPSVLLQTIALCDEETPRCELRIFLGIQESIPLWGLHLVSLLSLSLSLSLSLAR